MTSTDKNVPIVIQPAPTPTIQTTNPIKMDPLNQLALQIILSQGTYKHMTTHETPVQTFTYLELRERYG